MHVSIYEVSSYYLKRKWQYYFNQIKMCILVALCDSFLFLKLLPYKWKVSTESHIYKYIQIPSFLKQQIFGLNKMDKN